MADKDQNQNLEDNTSLDGDLEEYGVWVKAGPDDVDENEGESLFGLADLDDDSDTTLTNEEEDLLADLEEQEPEEQGPEDSGEGASESLESLDLDDEDLSLDDLDLPEPSFEDDLADLSLDAEEVESEVESIEVEASEDEVSIESIDSFEEEGFDLEGIPGSEDQDDFSDLVIDDDEEPSSAEELPELEYEDDQPTLEAELGEEDLGGIDLDESDLGEIELEEPVELDGESLPSPESLEEDFDDVSAVEASMTEPISASERPQSQSQADGRVLATIEEELASIKSELHQLRAELATFRSSGASAPEPRRAEQTDTDEGPEETGFFDEDEDETIALTGDELDNILNTAEFTEEAGEPSDYEDFEVSPELEDSDILGEGEDLIPEEIDLTPDEGLEQETEITAVDLDLDDEDDESPIEEITLEDIEAESDEVEDLSIGSEDVPAIELPDEETFGGDDTDVAALAEMDIESELAGIDDLKDEPEEEEEMIFEPEDETEESIELDLSGLDEGETAEPEEIEEELELEVESVEESPEEMELPESELGGTELPSETELSSEAGEGLPADLKGEIRSVLAYMDQLLEALPEDKIEEFARSEHFEVYKRLFEELGLEQR